MNFACLPVFYRFCTTSLKLTMPSLDLKKKAFALLTAWYEEHRPSSGAEPERYVVCAGLAVLEHLRESFPLTPEHYITERNQVKTSGSMIKAILARYSEKRTYAREGGRTTRGTRTTAERLVKLINSFTELSALPTEKRVALIDALQGWLAERAKEYFNRQRIEVEINLERP